LIYENEVDSFLEYIEFLHKNNVDAVIIQDFGMFDLVRKTFPNLELHASTQMHIHNLDGVSLMERLGMHRVVLARETSIDEIKYIKENSNVELEIFVHGALCISYSGQCLMSSLIGGRSGNRGACAGSCRLKYDVIDTNGKKLNKGMYPLSTKDLNSLEHIGELIVSGVASFKIEGRMKSPEYVYMVVSLYRMAIDSYYRDGIVKFNDDDLIKLKGVGNKTANVIEAVGFGKQAFAVDTHILRVSNRLGLVNTKSPDVCEKSLVKLFKDKDFGQVHHLMLLFGRYYCTARNPKCETCVLKDICKNIREV
jgi:putative protease